MWANFGGPWNEKCWYILRPLGINYGHWVNFMPIWYIFPRFSVSRKNLATQVEGNKKRKKFFMYGLP
jgi:hypothetical protein